LAFWHLHLEISRGTFESSTAYETGEELLLIQWGVFSAAFFLMTLKKNRALQIVFGLLTITFFLLAGGVRDADAKKVGGYVGFLCGLAACYTGVAEIWEETYPGCTPPGLGKLQ
jgi:succinate-acetate transporter protein